MRRGEKRNRCGESDGELHELVGLVKQAVTGDIERDAGLATQREK